MTIIGFNFTSIEGFKNLEHKAVVSGGLEVNHSISFAKVVKIPLLVNNTQSDVLRVEFEFSIKYQEVGTITLKGDALYTDTPEILEESIKAFEVDKKLPEMIDLSIRKFVYNKCLMQSMNLSDLLNLPAPIPFPKFEKKKAAE